MADSDPYASARYASLEGRSVVITGGASGIGAEMVRAFSAQGANVVFLDIDTASGRGVAKATGARFVECDLTDIAKLRAVLGLFRIFGAGWGIHG